MNLQEIKQIYQNSFLINNKAMNAEQTAGVIFMFLMSIFVSVAILISINEEIDSLRRYVEMLNNKTIELIVNDK